MRNNILAAGLAIAMAAMVLPAEAQAPPQGRNRAAVQPQAQAQPPQEKCLRGVLDGSCVNPVVADAARLRGFIIPQVRVSYFGTPAGTVGGDYIPFERLFQDNPVLFGLPTNVFPQSCCITRSK